MPLSKIKEIHTKNDDPQDFFYLGYFLQKGPEWSLIQVIANDCSLGSLMLLRNDQIAAVLSASPNIDLVQAEMAHHGLLDPMHLGPYVDDIRGGEMINLQQALNYSLSMQQSVVIINKAGEQFIGYVTAYNRREMRLKEINYYDKQLQSYDTVIPVKDIVTIHLFNEETTLMDAYFANASDKNFSGNLIEMYMNFNDERDEWPWIGVITAQNERYFLFEHIDPVGCLSGLDLINRRLVYYIAQESSNLNYYRFIVALKQQMGIFDVDRIENKLQDLRSLPDFDQVLANKKKEELFTVNNQAYDAADTGLLTKFDQNGFQMNLINNLEFVGDLENFSFANTISMSIWSKETATLSSILRSGHQN